LDPVGKDDRHLGDSKPASARSPAQLDLKPIPSAVHSAEIQSLQDLTTKTLKSTCEVSLGESENGARVEIAETTDGQSVRAPALDASTLHIATAEHEISIGDGSEEVGKVARLVAEVGVHLEYEAVIPLQCPVKAVDIRRSQASWPAAVTHMNPRVFSGDGIGQLAGAVRTEIVDHQDVGGWQHLEDGRNDSRKILRLVIGRNDHQSAGAV